MYHYNSASKDTDEVVRPTKLHTRLFSEHQRFYKQILHYFNTTKYTTEDWVNKFKGIHQISSRSTRLKSK